MRALGILLVALLAAAPAAAEEPEPGVPLPELYERLQESVVRIHTREGNGSGFAIEGGVATAWHVVSRQGDIVLETADRRFVRATIVGFDRSADVALLEPMSPLLVPELPLSEVLPQVGEQLVAVGHPLATGKPLEGEREGLLEWSFTAGMVSQVGPRQLQTTVSLQPGNSGGPLLDTNGQVVGVAIQRVGDFGVAVRIEPLLDLLADPAPQLPRPRVAPRLVVMAHLDMLPGAEPRSRRVFGGVGAGVDVVVARRFVGRLRARWAGMLDRNARRAGERARRVSIVGGAGPYFELPFEPHRPAPPSLEPYGFAGAVEAGEGERVETAAQLDPDCDPTVQSCAFVFDKETVWEKSWRPVVGVGFRAGSSTFAGELEVSTSPGDPLGQLRISLAFVLGFLPP